MSDLAERYRGYIACLNARRWDDLGAFVGGAVVHNARPLGLAGYRAMLENDVATFPDLRFKVALLVAGDDLLASRLDFHVTPAAEFLGLQPSGRPISFSENVIYRFEDGRIQQVWSIIDKAAVEAQMAPRPFGEHRTMPSRS